MKEAGKADFIKEPTNTQYTVGLLFRDNAQEVALIEKTHPEWQKGRLNGIGGKMEPGETPPQAQAREFLEEAGAQIIHWRPFCEIKHRGRTIHYFVAHGDYPIHTTTEEKVSWHRVKDLPHLPVIPNLLWLIPMALDKDKVRALVEDAS